MRKGATVFLALALLAMLVAGSADAWVRARMYDGATPMGPQWPILEKPSWEIESEFDYEELRSGEPNGPSADLRFSWRVHLTNQQSDNKVKVRINNIDPSKDTAAKWSGCMVTPTDPNVSEKTPSIYIRTDAGSVKLGYNNDPGKTRGWYVRDGKVTSGGVDIGCGISLNGVYFVDSNTGFVVGGSGTVLKTIDGGANWALQTSGTQNDLHGVNFATAILGWAVGEGGTILKTIDGGTNWTSQTVLAAGAPPFAPGLRSVHFIDANTGWAVGTKGTIFKTTDGGANWTQQIHGLTTQELRTVRFADANTGWAVGHRGIVLNTTNGGTNWVKQTSPYGDRHYGVDCVSATNAWAVGRDGFIIVTTNGGANWTYQRSPADQPDLNSVDFVDANTGWTVGDDGTVLKTTNAGVSWNAQTSGTTEDLLRVHFVDLSNGWAVGNHGTIISTTDGGANWTAQTSGMSVGMAVPHGAWHTIQVTAYVTGLKAGTWEMWINEGDAVLGVPDMTGDLGGFPGNYVQWGAIDSSKDAATFFTEYFNWGQDDEMPVPPAIGGESAAVVGNTATIAWSTTNTVLTNNKVYYGKTYYNPAVPTWQSANGVWVVDHWEATLAGLDDSQVYTYYCEQRDDVSGWEADTRLRSFRTDPAAQTQVLNPGFESGVDIYPWVDVYAPTPPDDDTQRWGRVYRDIDFGFSGVVEPLTDEAFSGMKTAQSPFRKNAVCRQKLTVTPGTWYKATVMFLGWGNIWYNAGDMVGRIGLDPNGHDTPGTRYADGSFTPDADVWWGEATANQLPDPPGWNQAATFAKASGGLMSLFLQADYNMGNTGVRIAFDDVTFEELIPPPATTCAGVKTTTSLGDPVDLQGVVVTLAQFDALGNAFGYVEDSNRAAGIRVYEPANSFLWDIFTLGVDTRVDVVGILELNSDQELQVRIMSISAAGGTEVIYPFGTTNKSIGGGTLGLQVGVENGVGTNNIGLLMRTWGKVTAVEPAGVMMGDEFSIFIDDGSGLVGGVTGETTTHPGIEVVVPIGLSIDPDDVKTGNKYLLATGAASMKSWDPGTGAVLKPLILIRDENDIQYSDF